MGKTVRHSVFETNSSSSHSLVIEKIRDTDIIINNGILDLDDLEKFSYDDRGYCDISIFTCDTPNKKLALAFAMMIDNYKDNEDEEINQKFDALMNKYNIVEVIGEYSIYDEGGQVDDLIKVIDDNSYIVRSVYSSN
jgi:hypothetical protein